MSVIDLFIIVINNTSSLSCYQHAVWSLKWSLGVMELEEHEPICTLLSMRRIKEKLKQKDDKSNVATKLSQVIRFVLASFDIYIFIYVNYLSIYYLSLSILLNVDT